MKSTHNENYRNTYPFVTTNLRWRISQFTYQATTAIKAKAQFTGLKANKCEAHKKLKDE